MELIPMIGAAYASITAVDACIKTLMLQKVYLKAKKASGKLKYRKFLTEKSKNCLREVPMLHIETIFNSIVPNSFIPVYNFGQTQHIKSKEENLYNIYYNFMSKTIEFVNENEEESRKSAAEFLAWVYETQKEHLPETYKGHRLEDATIRISREEVNRFLYKNDFDIIDLGVSDDNSYESYKVVYRYDKENS